MIELHMYSQSLTPFHKGSQALADPSGNRADIILLHYLKNYKSCELYRFIFTSIGFIAEAPENSPIKLGLFRNTFLVKGEYIPRLS